MAAGASSHRLTQCRIKVGAIDAAALGPFVKWAHGHGVTRKFSVFSWFHTAGSGITVMHHREVEKAPKSTAQPR